ncbi:hypothetical protein [Mycobacterium ostraviense]|uniref:hypothetical protein n=1 Tax=Mycobacterium ostraviense TaxID=2738409 RepID=UPI000ACD9995|nr:hypothetical protein [Mycobacterium ostraviense]UGT90460.1 hypothetical protein LTS72_19375 [Mycobacterium ostraviense]
MVVHPWPAFSPEADSFVAAFGRAADAVACALQLQRAQLPPIRLRVGVHTGDVQLRDDSNYVGPTINRAARLRELAMAARHCCPPPPATSSSTSSRPMPG